MVSEVDKSHKVIPVDMKISKVKFDHKQTTVASLFRRKTSSSIQPTNRQTLAVEVQIAEANGRGCTHVHPTDKTGSESRINLINKSIGEEFIQLVTDFDT